MLLNDIEKIFPNLNYEYLCLNSIPRLRILFPNNNLENIRLNNKLLLDKLLKNKSKIYWAVSFFSTNSKKISKKSYNEIYLAWLYWILNKWELHINRIEEKFYLHTYLLKLDFEDIIYLSEISIASHHLASDKINIPYIDWIFTYIFDSNFEFVINVYWFEWIDIWSYNKNILFKIRDSFKNDFKVLDNKVDIDL